VLEVILSLTHKWSCQKPALRIMLGITQHRVRMAKLSDLVSCTSKVTGVSLATVQEAGRRLREGKLIQTGTGGRYGGADMAAEDAASLLTAILILRASSASLSEIVRLTRFHLKELRAHNQGDRFVLDSWHQELALPQLCRLKKGHTFGDALTSLINSISNGDLDKAIKYWASSRPRNVGPYFDFGVTVYGPRPFSEAQIYFRTSAFERDLNYLRPLDRVKPVAMRRSARDLREIKPLGFNLVVSAGIDDYTLAEVGALLARVERNDEPD
jgi:hypothetical protein